MISVTPGLLESFLVIDVHDPDELGADSAVSRRFPRGNDAHRYTLRGRPPPRGGGDGAARGPLTRLAMRPAGDLMAAYVAERRGSEVRVVGEPPDRFCLGLMLAGAMEIRTPDGREAAARGDRGLVYRGAAGTRFLTEDGNARLNLWVAAGRVERTLEGLLGGERLRRPLAFEPSLDLSAGMGASLRGLLGTAAAELGRPDGLASNPVALASLTDLVVQAMLQGLPHSHREALAVRAAAGGAAPGHLRRAEAFMRAHADRPLPLAEVAAAAGCSLRALHAAFRRFRGTTPLAALHAARLDAVRAALPRGGEDGGPAASAGEVARRCGFTNRGRFAAAYARRFGEPPPGARRRG